MAFQATSTDEVVLSILFSQQAKDFDEFLDVADISELIAETKDQTGTEIYSVHSRDPKKARALWRDLESLERQGLLEFDRSNPHVKLTADGIFRALLFSVPEPVLKTIAQRTQA